MRIHYLQHVPFEGPARIGDWAKKRGHVLTGTHFYRNDPLPQAAEFDWLVIMGGPMNIYEEDKYAWLKEEKVFIRQAIQAGKVVLGICLGAQLITDVLGGVVTKNPVGEIGWLPITFREAAFTYPWFREFPAVLPVFHWHNDTFSTLPPGAVWIAESEACPHQAFVYQNKVIGFQFHMESNEAAVEALLENCGEELVPGPYIQTAEQIRAGLETLKEANQAMDGLLDRLAGDWELQQISYTKRSCQDQEKISAFLEAQRVGALAMCDSLGRPYVVPINYVYWQGKCYFHGMGSGKKNEILKTNPDVCFTLYQEWGTLTDPVPCKCDTAYFSVMIFGRVRAVTDPEEKARSLTRLMDKFVPGLFAKPLSASFVRGYRSGMDHNPVAVYCIDPVEITAKESPVDLSAMFSKIPPHQAE